MNRLIVSAFSLLLLFTAAFTAGPIQAQTLEETPQNIIKENVVVIDDGMATFVIEEERLARVRHILDYLLQNARDHAARGEFDQAAKELEMAASYMYVDVQSATDNIKDDVLLAADHLETIARATDYSKTPVSVYDSAIFSAHYALSDYYRQRAETFFDADLKKSAGFALEAALVHYQHAAMSWARLGDVQIDEVGDPTLNQGLAEFALAMQNSQPVSTADASVLIDRLEAELKKLTRDS